MASHLRNFVILKEDRKEEHYGCEKLDYSDLVTKQMLNLICKNLFLYSPDGGRALPKPVIVKYKTVKSNANALILN